MSRGVEYSIKYLTLLSRQEYLANSSCIKYYVYVKRLTKLRNNLKSNSGKLNVNIIQYSCSFLVTKAVGIGVTVDTSVARVGVGAAPRI